VLVPVTQLPGGDVTTSGVAASTKGVKRKRRQPVAATSTPVYQNATSSSAEAEPTAPVRGLEHRAISHADLGAFIQSQSESHLSHTESITNILSRTDSMGLGGLALQRPDSSDNLLQRVDSSDNILPSRTDSLSSLLLDGIPDAPNLPKQFSTESSDGVFPFSVSAVDSSKISPEAEPASGFQRALSGTFLT